MRDRHTNRKQIVVNDDEVELLHVMSDIPVTQSRTVLPYGAGRTSLP